MPESWEDQSLLSSSVAQGGVADSAGNIIIGATTDSPSDNVDPRQTDFILYGVYNGAFARGPRRPNDDLGDDNPLPDWTGPTVSSGGGFTWTWVSDSASPSTYNLRANIPAGAAGDADYFEQIVPIGGQRDRVLGFALRTDFYNNGATTFGATSELQYLKADQSTTTGSAFTSSTTSIAAGVLKTQYAEPSTAPPADAAYIRIRVGVQRGVGATTDTGSIDIVNVRLERQLGRVRIPDEAAPDTYQASTIYQSGGTLISTTPNGDFYYSLGIRIPETSAPGSSSGGYRIYAKTDGILYGKDDSGNETRLSGGGLVTIYTSGTNNWTPQPGSTACRVVLNGGGGGGASGACGGSGLVRAGGGGGGGGCHVEQNYSIATLSTPVTVTIGAGGAGGGQAGTAASNGNDGTAGGNTTFGSYLTAYGGGPGLGPNNAIANETGGSGAGTAAAGIIGATGTTSLGGAPASTAGAHGISGQGGGGNSASAGGSAEWGGAAGGGHGTAADSDTAGGTSLWGAGGGGAGGNGGSSQNGGSAGGNTGVYVTAGGGGGAGGAARAAGTAGSAGGGTGSGTGGGGGGGSNSSAVDGGKGGNGGLGGGGGGGGGASVSGGTAKSGAGGTGGNGVAIIIEW